VAAGKILSPKNADHTSDEISSGVTPLLSSSSQFEEENKEDRENSEAESKSADDAETVERADIDAKVLLVGELAVQEMTSEWLATNLFQFFKEVCLLYALASDDAVDRFPKMGMGFPPKYEYRWAPPLGKRKTRPERCSGPDYVQNVLGFIEDVINDQAHFPMDENRLFPSDFVEIAKKLYTRLFRVFAIMFHHFVETLGEQGFNLYLQQSFRNFMFLCFEYDLIRDREFRALQEIVDEVHAEFLVWKENNNRDLVVVSSQQIDPLVRKIIDRGLEDGQQSSDDEEEEKSGLETKPPLVDWTVPSFIKITRSASASTEIQNVNESNGSSIENRSEEKYLTKKNRGNSTGSSIFSRWFR